MRRSSGPETRRRRPAEISRVTILLAQIMVDVIGTVSSTSTNPVIVVENAPTTGRVRFGPASRSQDVPGKHVNKGPSRYIG
jgi:hypothetical protein